MTHEEMEKLADMSLTKHAVKAINAFYGCPPAAASRERLPNLPTAALIVEHDRGPNSPPGNSGFYNGQQMLDYARAALAHAGRDAADAARYRWLRQKGSLSRAAHIAVLTKNGGFVAEKEEIADKAIDTAIAATKT